MNSMQALRAAGIVGTWETDVVAGRSLLDAQAAALMAGDQALADVPLPLDVALGRVHPADRGWVFERIRRVRQTGGPFSAEFRVRTNSGEVRWVLNRGVLAPDASGAMRGLGAYIDTTDVHRGSFMPRGADRPAARSLDADPLEAAADLCISARDVIERTGKPSLRLLIDMLLLEIGRTLARRRAPRP
jgi:hypothetical protein